MSRPSPMLRLLIFGLVTNSVLSLMCNIFCHDCANGMILQHEFLYGSVVPVQYAILCDAIIHAKSLV
uniref:Uncharacterized protein n=1 Tax=Arundo donax TaxID=35708 RepID=A0A0A8Z6K0_ARUDO